MTSNENKDKKYDSILKQIEEEHNTNKGTLFDINSRVLIADGLNFFIRSFSANPAVNDDGVHIGGIIGFLKSLRYILASIKPTRCIIVFDGKGGARKRQKLYPEYKKQREVRHQYNRKVDWSISPQDEDQAIRAQISRLIKYLELLPMTLLIVDGTEADDVIAYISKQILKDSRIIITSTDRDFYQLIDNRITIWNPIKKIEYTEQIIQEEFGIPANNFLTYRILDGDASDNINGIRGAGLKSIKKYIDPITKESFSVKDLIEYAETADSKYELIKKIKRNTILLKRNYLLMQLNNVDLSNHNRLRIQSAIRKKIPQLIKYKFSTMFIQDKLWSHIPNIDSWFVEFIRLDRIRGLGQNGDK